ncbi:hypothetical protein BJY04DRAFT_223382 [Aspergillus karnatakaensis]|uniref:helix-loop-helix domain-containing protein n=1 Tax=Aspergillus karnatakaensis TaxID=1810916 RepID=UPI003CCE066D
MPPEQPRKTKRGRARPLPAHVMARNLAIEKRRRVELNEDFLNLARLLPTLAHTRRLSKVLIVNEALRHLSAQRDICVAAGRDMQGLLAENSRLRAEVEVLRASRCGCGGVPIPTAAPTPAAPPPVTEAMAQLMSVKDQVYGVFPAGFGDNWAPEFINRRSSGNSGADGHNSTQGDGVSLETQVLAMDMGLKMGRGLSRSTPSLPTQLEGSKFPVSHSAPTPSETTVSGIEPSSSSHPSGGMLPELSISEPSSGSPALSELIDECLAAPMLPSDGISPISPAMGLPGGICPGLAGSIPDDLFSLFDTVIEGIDIDMDLNYAFSGIETRAQ